MTFFALLHRKGNQICIFYSLPSILNIGYTGICAAKYKIQHFIHIIMLLAAIVYFNSHIYLIVSLRCKNIDQTAIKKLHSVFIVVNDFTA